MKVRRTVFFIWSCLTFTVVFNHLNIFLTKISTQLVRINRDHDKFAKNASISKGVTFGKDVEQTVEKPRPDVSRMQISLKENTASKTINKKYRIVLYHFYHVLLKWKAKNLDMSKCGVYKNCEISEQKQRSSEFIDADAIVFQGNHMPGIKPKRLSSDQVFVYVNIESPQYLQIVKLAGSTLQDFFNWTMSYRFDSDIPYLYGSIVPRNVSKEEVLGESELTGKIYNYRDFLNMTTHWPNKYKGIPGKDYDAIFERKTKSSVWFVSHCGTASKREKFVESMKTVTNVDIFGRCSPMKNICPKTQKNCSDNIQESYKFVLALENSLCEDYITEKVFDRYNLDIIIVVYGAHNYSEYLPKGTYIDANDFASPEELGKYINFVGSNKQVYLDYLKRKDQYKAILENDHVQLAYCTLCYRLNKLNEYRKPASPLQQWWNRPGVCRHKTILDTKFKRPR